MPVPPQSVYDWSTLRKERFVAEKDLLRIVHTQQNMALVEEFKKISEEVSAAPGRHLMRRYHEEHSGLAARQRSEQEKLTEDLFQDLEKTGYPLATFGYRRDPAASQPPADLTRVKNDDNLPKHYIAREMALIARAAAHIAGNPEGGATAESSNNAGLQRPSGNYLPSSSRNNSLHRR
ncbi:hypothetical protein [Streptomyces tauricus]|uniref:hypothetical protein n=1 Tax=Streptomyces tauricus TaxID=68274 RepID=UPI002244DBEF|nr:hypothetical protein [Streptomyces tauricus]MCW8101748.1 hypothetical protein [Streptomyces tauricus]